MNNFLPITKVQYIELQWRTKTSRIEIFVVTHKSTKSVKIFSLEIIRSYNAVAKLGFVSLAIYSHQVSCMVISFLCRCKLATKEITIVIYKNNNIL